MSTARLETPYTVATRLMGVHEAPGPATNHFITWALSLVGMGADAPDETPWCSAFVYALAYLLGLPRPETRAAAARSWILVGEPVEPLEARQGYDVVVLQRGAGPQPPATVIAAPGHVGLFSSYEDGYVWILGGNQGNAVSLARFQISRVLGIRRLWSDV